jgi:penicillin-binding protein 1C
MQGSDFFKMTQKNSQSDIRPFILLAGVNLAAWLLYKLIILLSLWAFPLPLAPLETDYSTLHLDSRGHLLRISLSPSGKYRLRLPLHRISDTLRRGFVAYEDRYFFVHAGVNPLAVLRALAVNTRHGRVLMGGSTLTMQIAKLLEPKRRTYWAKGVEVLRAWQLESRYSKDQLLELYLNSVPMGGNLEGVGAAAYLYLGKPADALSVSECALLIGLPKSPRLNRPDRHPEAARAQRAKVLSAVARDLNLSPRQVLSAGQAALPLKRFANPYECRHLLARTRRESPRPLREYTLDPGLQAFCETRLSAASEKLKTWDIYNGAVLVIDNRSMQVLAYVGSPDFNDAKHGGQVNGAAILRSPGSLLKPFLYARALEAGKLTPRTVVYDLERNYDGYQPVNYERKFWGPLPAQDALAFSLNGPAVELEYALGAEKGLSGFLRASHLVGPRLAQSNPGLSLVLGAMPLSLEELVSLYSVFSNQGRLRRLVFFEDDLAAPNSGAPLLSPESAFITSEMLARLLRPDLPQAWEFTANRGQIAYKTGTSFGLRDAWTVGFTPDYTVGVWLGNVNAHGSTALVGSKVAAPLMAEIMNELTRYRDAWFKKPAGVSTRRVCALSGAPLGPACTAALPDWFIPGVSSQQPCALHRRLIFDKQTGYEVCRTCMAKPAAAYAERTVEIWPPEVAAHLRAQGKTAGVEASHNPDCPALLSAEGLKIKSPLPHSRFALTQALATRKQKIPLTAQCQHPADRVFWYVDENLLGQTAPEETLYLEPKPGRHQIAAVNARGQSDKVEITVSRP